MRLIAILLALMMPWPMARAQEPDLTMRAPLELAESGLLRHLLPRFSLKTSIRIALADHGNLVIDSAPPGIPVFARGDTVYYLRHDNSTPAQRFADWLTSEIGRRTIESFAPDGATLFTAALAGPVSEGPADFTGDAERGRRLSAALCARCHVIGDQNRMKGLGSTPSFMVLRTLSDWDVRFETFYVRPPHGAFTQVDGVTPPFDPSRPPPISAVEITLQDLEAIIAFAAKVAPADLGAPIRHQ